MQKMLMGYEEKVAGLSVGIATLLFVGDGGIYPTVTGVAAVTQIFRRRRQAFGPECDRISRDITQTVLQKYVTENANRADLDSAIYSLENFLGTCVRYREALINSFVGPKGYFEPAVNYVMTELGQLDPELFGPQASDTTTFRFAHDIVSASIKAAIEDRSFYERIEHLLIPELATAVGQTREDVKEVMKQNSETNDKLNEIQRSLNPKSDTQHHNHWINLREAANRHGGKNHSVRDDIYQRRRDAIGNQADWNKTLNGLYHSRDLVFSELCSRFENWYKKSSEVEDGKFPVFWIDGRSGDGKSVLLLQLARWILERYPEVNLFKPLPTKLNTLAEDILSRSGAQERVVLIVDNLHLCRGEDRFEEKLSGYIESSFRPVLIVACGPTPEKNDFLKASGSVVELASFEVPPFTRKEAENFALWFGRKLPQERESSDLLAEFLFELSVNDSITNFAKNFKTRLGSFDLYEPVRLAMPINALDVAADIILLGREGQKRLARLTKPDQRHFEYVNSLELEFRFRHPRIAWAVWRAWTDDPLSGATVEEMLVHDLAPSLRLRASDHRSALQLLSAVRVRSADPAMAFSATAVLEQCVKLFQHEDNDHTLLCVSALSLVSQLVVTGDKPNPQTYLTLKSLVKESRCTREVRLLMFGSLLIIASRQGDQDFADLQETFWSLSAQAGFEKPAGSVVPMLASYSELASWNWEAKFVGLLQAYFESDQLDRSYLANVFQFAISEFPDNKDILGFAHTWVRDGDMSSAKGHILGKLLGRREVTEDIVDIACDWAKDNERIPGKSNLWIKLLQHHRAKHGVIEGAKSWASSLPEIASQGNLWAKLLEISPNDPDLVTDVQRWLEKAHPLSSHANIWSRLVSSKRIQNEIIRSALKWTLSPPTLNSVIGLWVDMLKRVSRGDCPPSLKAECLKACLRFLNGQDSEQFCAIWAQLVTLRKRSIRLASCAVKWIELHPNAEGLSNLWCSVLASNIGNDFIENKANRWIETRVQKDEIYFEVLFQISVNRPNNAKHIEELLTWAISNDQGVVHKIWPFLIGAARNPSFHNLQIIEKAALWLDKYGQRPETVNLWDKLLGVHPDEMRDRIKDQAARWLLKQQARPIVANLLLKLLDSQPVAHDILEYGMQWRLKNAEHGHSELVYSALLANRIHAENGSPKVIAEAKAYCETNYNPELVIRPLRLWIATGKDLGGAAQTIVGLKVQATEGSRSRNYDQARIKYLKLLCANNFRIFLEADSIPAETAKEICWLIAAGIQFIPGSGAQLLACYEMWPDHSRVALWRGILQSRDLSIENYGQALIGWLRRYSKCPDQVFKALVFRPELDAWLAASGFENLVAELVRKRSIQRVAS